MPLGAWTLQETAMSTASFSRPSQADFDPERYTLAEADLRQALDEHLRRGGEVLDLRAHAAALSSATDELMERFADACRRAQRRVRVLRLPADIQAPPVWLGAFPRLEQLSAPGLRAQQPALPWALAA
jgi:hypothetical protein